jgi:hypothetical protein
MSRHLFISAAAAAAALAGCQSVGGPVPAVLSSSDAATIDRLKTALASAMGRAQVELGPGDPTQSPTVSVLPRPVGPPDDRSLAVPTVFRLEIEGGECFVVREENGARTRIDGAQCRPA